MVDTWYESACTVYIKENPAFHVMKRSIYVHVKWTYDYWTTKNLTSDSTNLEIIQTVLELKENYEEAKVVNS